MAGFRIPSLSEIDTQIETTKSKIADLQSHLSALEGFKVAAEQLKLASKGRKTVAGHVPITPKLPAAVPIAGAQKAVNDTSGIAYQILSTSGAPMRLSEIVPRMVALGWTSSGKARTDRNRLWSAMNGMPKKFRNSSRGMWEALPQQKPKN
jgi:hypothetical protein